MAEKMIFFGGTFDPVHNGHLIVARAVSEALGAGGITLVPSGTPPHKAPAHATACQRLKMLQLAVEDERGLDVCDLEIDRTGPSYTFDTLAALGRLYPGCRLAWVVGADMVADLPLWHRAPEVLEMADIIIAVRPSFAERLPAIFQGLSGKMDGRQIDKLKASVVHTPLIEVSSTLIRDRIRQGLSIRYLVPEPVRLFIEEYGVYPTSVA